MRLPPPCAQEVRSRNLRIQAAISAAGAALADYLEPGDRLDAHELLKRLAEAVTYAKRASAVEARVVMDHFEVRDG